ncbi:SUKH-4 family immunity protein [Streptomyces cyaneus]|uniref:SUKH-4 family immunity protein n=1 Tax=Streptomyces cyaneus TaxID=1904 RepID=UPI0013E38F30|nr:SUKH-4 family immunity protein [Streptomyces cyaneus]
MLSEDAELEILDWLLDPPKAAPMLSLRGSPGVGKSALLTALHEDLPDSLLLDCRGLTAEEVLGRLLTHFGLKVRHRPLRDPLEDALAGMRTGGIVLLANVQWSGRLFSSPDEGYDIQRVAAQFSRRGQGHVLPVLELGGPSGPARADGTDEIVLEAEVEGPDPAALLMGYPALRALAASELREIPLHVWAFLDTALGGRRTEDDLRRSGQELSAVLRLEPAADGATTVRLSTDALKHLLREAAPLTRAEQQSMADALLAEARRHAEGTADARIVAYANRALAVHAALSGTLPQLIDDDPVLAAFADRVSLQQAIRLAWPEGPPVGGVAGDAHYLDGDGVTPDSQSEWLAWLHWAAVNRGRRDWADALENASPEPLAWRTAWSKWRPYGVLGDRPELAGSVDRVDIGTFAGTPVAASQCDGFFDKEDDYDVELGDTEALERVWRLSDGRELLAPRVVQQFITSEGAVERTAGGALETRRHIRSPDPARGPELPMRLLPDCGAEAVDGDRWVAYGPRGLYAFDVLRPEELTPGTGPWRRSLVPSFRSTAVWPMPTPVSGQAAALTAWCATAFGDQALRRLPVSALPAALTEPEARALLCEVGFPELDGSAPAFLTTVAVNEAGLTPVERSETSEPAYLLGHWLAEPIILEGRSGRVLLASVAGTELLGSSLSQFMTLVGLYRLLPLSDFPRGSAEKADAHWSVKAWAKEIDPEAAASSNWQAALGGYLDDLESL